MGRRHASPPPCLFPASAASPTFLQFRRHPELLYYFFFIFHASPSSCLSIQLLLFFSLHPSVPHFSLSSHSSFMSDTIYLSNLFPQKENKKVMTTMTRFPSPLPSSLNSRTHFSQQFSCRLSSLLPSCCFASSSSPTQIHPSLPPPPPPPPPPPSPPPSLLT